MATMFSTIVLVGISLLLSRLVTTSIIFSCSLGNLNQRKIDEQSCGQRDSVLPQHFLLHLVTTVLDDSLHLLMNQFNTSQTRLLQSLDLSLHQQLETNLGNKQRWPGSITVPDGCQYVHGCETYENGLLLFVNQSEDSIILCQPIRRQCYFVSTNQETVSSRINQYETSIHL